MGLIQWFIKRQALKEMRKTAITDEMREKALEIRRLNHKVNQLEKTVDLKTRIDGIQASLGSNSNFEEQLIMQVLPMLLQKGNSQQFPIPPQNEAIAQVDFSEEQIKAIINGNPNLKQHASLFSDDEIKNYLNQQIPNVSETTINKIICEVRK